MSAVQLTYGFFADGFFFYTFDGVQGILNNISFPRLAEELFDRISW